MRFSVLSSPLFAPIRSLTIVRDIGYRTSHSLARSTIHRIPSFSSAVDPLLDGCTDWPAAPPHHHLPACKQSRISAKGKEKALAILLAEQLTPADLQPPPFDAQSYHNLGPTLPASPADRRTCLHRSTHAKRYRTGLVLEHSKSSRPDRFTRRASKRGFWPAPKPACGQR